jgi:hypothetical protein
MKKPQYELDYEFQKRSKKYKRRYFNSLDQLHVKDDIYAEQITTKEVNQGTNPRMADTISTGKVG